MIRAAALVLALTAGAFASGAPAPKDPAQKKIVLVRTGALVDVLQGRVLTGQDVLIEDGVIVKVGPGLAAPAGAAVFDLTKKTVLPGLIDVHTHVTSQPEDYYADQFRKSPIDVAVTAHVYARRTLEAGFTTLRVVGAEEYIDVALRNAIDKGMVVGPRLKVAGLPIGATGGHADLTGFSPYLKFTGFSNVADGPEAIILMTSAPNFTFWRTSLRIASGPSATLLNPVNFR